MGKLELAFDGYKEGLQIAEHSLAENPDFLGPYDFACHRALALLCHSIEFPIRNAEQEIVRTRLKKAALDAVRSLLDTGYGNFEALSSDPDLESLKNDPDFKVLLESRKPRAAPSSN